MVASLTCFAANNVSAAVADLNQIEQVAFDGCSREGRAHPGAARVFLTSMMNRQIGVDGGVAQVINEGLFAIVR